MRGTFHEPPQLKVKALMTNPPGAQPLPSPGWYPTGADGNHLGYWDGTAWAPAMPAKKPTRTGWLAGCLGLVVVGGLLFVAGMFVGSAIASNPTATPAAQGGDEAERKRCDSAMARAASVPDMDNDAELFAAAEACTTVAHWTEALIAHPGAGGLTDYTATEAESFLRAVCVEVPESAACLDAEDRGILEG